jgi:hypothetical protein
MRQAKWALLALGTSPHRRVLIGLGVTAAFVGNARFISWPQRHLTAFDLSIRIKMTPARHRPPAATWPLDTLDLNA